MATFAGLYSEVTLNTQGVPKKNLAVTVYNDGTSTLATLYTDNTKATTASNPVLTDSRGNLIFYAEPGEYELVAADDPDRKKVTVHPKPSEVLSATGGGAVADHVAEADPHTQYQKESEKGLASGYAALDSTTKVPVAQLGTGTADSSTFLRGDRSWGIPPGGGGGGKHVIKDEGTSLTERAALNFVGDSVVATDDSANNESDITINHLNTAVHTVDQPAAAHAIDGAKHTASGLTTGHFMKATSATAFAFGALTYADIRSLLEDLQTFSKAGTLVVEAGKGRFRFPFAATILGVTAAINTAPAGSSVIVDVNKNGSTIFTTQANRPTIAAGANATTTEPTPDVTAITSGDEVRVDIDQIGSSTAGADLTVFLRYRRT